MSSTDLISEEYKALNSKLHSDSQEYGNNNDYLCEHLPGSISIVHKLFKCNSVLDYGCGKGMIVRSLQDKLANHKISIQGYDPCVQQYQNLPSPADVVISTDVLEHIEPDKIDGVLDHISNLTSICCYLVIDLLPAVKSLPDGRNAHIMLETSGWWLNKLSEFFKAGVHLIVEKEANLTKKAAHTKKLIFIGTKKNKDILVALNLFSATHANTIQRAAKV